MKRLIFLLLVFSYFLMHAQTIQSLWGMTQFGGPNGNGTILKMNTDGTALQDEYDFVFSTGCRPAGNMLQASDGNLYGTTVSGGPNGSCVIFEYNPITGVYSDRHDFLGPNGYVPYSGLVELNGILYGVTEDGGTDSAGVIYSYNILSGIYSDIHDFDTVGGCAPYGSLSVINGKLFGMTSSGGSFNEGVMFSFDPSSSSFNVIRNFDGINDGKQPYGGLILASDGLIYGMTSSGGSNNSGTIFSYSLANGAFNIVHSFTSLTGSSPYNSLVEGPAGILYGTTSSGGINSYGTIFKYDINTGLYTDLHDFNGLMGAGPFGDPFYFSITGKLFGLAESGGINAMGTVYSFDTNTGIFSNMYSLDNSLGKWSMSGFCLVSIPDGVEDFYLNSSSISIVPSPAEHQINISSLIKGDVSFSIINSLGQSVMEWKENDVLNYHKLIDVSDLESGIYFLEMSNGTEVVTKKFVKE